MKCSECNHLDAINVVDGKAPCFAGQWPRVMPKTHYMSDGRPRVVPFLMDAIPATVELDDERPCGAFEPCSAPHAVKEAA